MKRAALLLLALASLGSLMLLLAWWTLSARLEVRVVSPNPVTVQVDGDPHRIKGSKTLRVWPGTHTVSASGEGYESFQSKISLRARSLGKVEVQLRPLTEGAPLLVHLPEQNAHFSIITEEDHEEIKYVITLYATFNDPDDLTRYEAELAQYKQEALAWIRSKGVDPTSLKIKWNPPRAERL
jgi:hypothetical protein